MTEKEIFISACGIDEDGEGKSIVMIETLFASPDPSKEEKIVDSITFDGTPVNIFRSLRSSLLDIQFRDNTDYDYVQALSILKDFTKAENSLDSSSESVPTVQVTLMPKDLEGLYYIVGIHGTWCAMSDEAGKLPNIIRFIFDNDLFHTYRISEAALDSDEMEKEVMEEINDMKLMSHY